ncbi:LOW QUALITY PROTEIN: protein hairless [Musca domestica]|uniref:LOW QUALITY PROTEIN: protein hairless n=1 Tax=Musca domestica TaxID=7370 RepID=A0A9J7D2Z6_MUSDO|nr:LOW QUALITY PROTEIN: protein hairless [Musca domestica]
MKILQNETASATATNDNVTEKEKLQHPIVVEKRKAKTLKNKILQNVAEQQQQLQRLQQHQSSVTSAATASSAIAMTDELTKNITPPTTNTDSSNSFKDLESVSPRANDKDSDVTCNSNRNSSSTAATTNSSNSDLIIAEAAKILLKNGLNGTNAAAAAAVATATATLLTAAANFQLPQQHQQQNLESTTTTLSTPSPTSTSSSTTPVANATTAAAAAHAAHLVAIATAAAAVNASNIHHHKRLTSTLAALNSSAASAFNSSLSSSKSSQNQQLNNGSSVGSSNSSSKSAQVSSSSATPVSTATTASQFAKPSFKASKGSVNTTASTMSTISSMDMGVIDYTVNSSSSNLSSNHNNNESASSSAIINLSSSANAHSNSHQRNFNNNSAHQYNRSDIGRNPISSSISSTNNNFHNATGSGGGAVGFGGGRLQFFKDGKFILELARSKDGEKGGWVSVPRKIFRTPSAATSSTVTPTATAATSGGIIPSPLLNPSTASVIGSSASGVSSGGGGSYSKNECSNSFSFSDDNSSLQSSPWQRDHGWKQTAPHKNISKEMALFYHKPAYLKLTPKALLLAQRKRRNPYNLVYLRMVPNCLKKRVNVARNDRADSLRMSIINLNSPLLMIWRQKLSRSSRKGLISPKKNQRVKKKSRKMTAAIQMTRRQKTAPRKHLEIRLIMQQEKMPQEADECNDVEMAKVISPMKKEDSSCHKGRMSPCEADNKEEKDMEKMNTSDCEADVLIESSKKLSSLNGSVSNEESVDSKVQGTTKTNNETPKPECQKPGDEEKRLKLTESNKSRAKLISIVQKLIDASASRIAENAPLSLKNSTRHQNSPPTTSSTSSSSSNTNYSTGGGGDGVHKHFQCSKVSPPSNTAASRLVEYHQQHVSPRKRILREFEKVSLEDNSTTAAGGKRSRAKGSSSTNSGSCTVQNFASSAASKTPSPAGYNTNNSNTGTAKTIGTSTVTTTSSVAPTKLYSSYSIHSLLGGNSNSSSSPSPSSSSCKKSHDVPATITSNSLAYSLAYQQSPVSSLPPHQSPKSPDGHQTTTCGGKSPSTSSSKIKRSPPYSSPMRETHSRSPSASSTHSYDYGRRSPRLMPDIYNKMKYSGLHEGSGSSPHHQAHQQLYQHHVPQSFYSPYMTSPQYVPPPSTLAAAGSSLSSPSTANASPSTTPTTNSSRSPRHHSSAFRATTPTSSTTSGVGGGGGIANHHNIPTTPRGDLSPQRSTTASPRETTPRTVPKKTASIRRQFASPTATTSNNHSSCPSPSSENRADDNDRRTPVSHHQQQQHLLHRSSPGSAASSMQASPMHPYSYMYAPGTGSPHHSTSAVSPTSNNTSIAAAAAAAAAAASYIPTVVGSPYYHPYISTLAAMRHPQMWMQHYQNAAAAAAANPSLLQASRHPGMLSAAAAAASRLSPPYHGFQYNGVSNAAALAAAAAAAGFGSTSAATPQHHAGSVLQPPPPGSMFNPMVHGLAAPSHPAALHAAGLVPATGMATAASAPPPAATLGPAQPMTDTSTDLSKASKNNYTSSSSSSLAPSSQLTDVPLNLSKH